MKSRDHWITGALALFCAVMTFLLVRSEYFPESSLLQQVPPESVIARIFKYATVSSMTIEWKGESIGSFSMRVTPSVATRVNSLLDCDVPVLGRKQKLFVETFCVLRSPRRIERLFVRGRWQASTFELSADSRTGQSVIQARGEGLNFRRELRLDDLLRGGVTNRLDALPDLPMGASMNQARQLAGNLAQWRVRAWNTRVHRFGDWMDAYLLSARLDDNWWFKLWLSPTGELLKLESSFGLRATNEDFFTPTSS